MSKLIFVSLPVADLARSTAFYEAVGATRNPQFSDETTACMVFSETIHVMLMTHDRFAMFTSKPIVDAKTACQMLVCLSAESREAVDAMVEKAAADGVVDPSPKDDHGFMYGRSFEDPDGHLFGVTWLDVAAMMAAKAA